MYTKTPFSGISLPSFRCHIKLNMCKKLTGKIAKKEREISSKRNKFSHVTRLCHCNSTSTDTCSTLFSRLLPLFSQLNRVRLKRDARAKAFISATKTQLRNQAADRRTHSRAELLDVIRAHALLRATINYEVARGRYFRRIGVLNHGSWHYDLSNWNNCRAYETRLLRFERSITRLHIIVDLKRIFNLYSWTFTTVLNKKKEKKLEFRE